MPRPPARAVVVLPAVLRGALRVLRARLGGVALAGSVKKKRKEKKKTKQNNNKKLTTSLTTLSS
ncbi:hypothetical protein ACPF8X_35770, partial [Streptomyces sp. G35A]